jgi:hypothetical protein
VSVSARRTKPEQNCHRFRISNNLANLGLVFATKKDPNWPLERERGDHIEILTASVQFSNSEVLNESL